ncbi:MAG: glycine zipper 2TM domain-containing protein [Sulfurospirillaceae bacterium]|nr:glycine zipper 2TM domain-containing protein [Sulfurospirillaceae bacterium]
MKKLLIFALVFASAATLFAESLSFEQSVRVIKSTPEYRTVTVRTPYQECWDEQVPVSTSSGNDNVGALIGGVAGGILGHQVGGGSGKTAATVGGAIIGTLVGKNLSENQNTQTTYQNQRRCVTRYKEGTSEKFIGYKNIAKYKNQTIIKYSDSPLQYIRLIINVSY